MPSMAKVRFVLNRNTTARDAVLMALEPLDIVSYMKNNIWLPIVLGVVGVLLLLLIVWVICYCRRNVQFGYSAVIKDDFSIAQKLEHKRRTLKTAERNAALLNCHYYLKDSDKYQMINQLPEIGSRVNKHWFRVSDSKTKTQTILAVLPWNSQCILPFNRSTMKTLTDLFTLLQFPYIFPITDIDLVFEHQLLVIMQPFQSCGSLKDFIYGQKPLVAWGMKYQIRKKGLSLSLVRNYGGQILEALMYLRDKGLPTCTHLHTGNIFIVNKVCKVSGYEMSLLGYTPRLQPLIRKAVKENKDLTEVISFGHVLFEMAFGYELTSLEPDAGQLVNCPSSGVTEVLNYLFFNENGQYPTIDELSVHKFFENADLSKSRKHNPGPIRFSSKVRTLLKLYRNEGDSRRRSRRRSIRRKREDSIESAQPKKERKSSRIKSKRSNSTISPNVVSPMVSPQNIHSFSLPSPPPLANVPAPPNVSTVHPPSSSKRGALLSDIRKGARLKKTTTNDRSAPRV